MECSIANERSTKVFIHKALETIIECVGIGDEVSLEVARRIAEQDSHFLDRLNIEGPLSISNAAQALQEFRGRIKTHSGRKPLLHFFFRKWTKADYYTVWQEALKEYQLTADQVRKI